MPESQPWVGSLLHTSLSYIPCLSPHICYSSILQSSLYPLVGNLYVLVILHINFPLFKLLCFCFLTGPNTELVPKAG